MSERRTLTIGVTINLGNYESLRLEVSDEAETEQDAAELAACLDRILAGYGSGDTATRAAIDKYRARVLTRYGAAPETTEDVIPDILIPETEPEPYSVTEPIMPTAEPPEPENLPVPEELETPAEPEPKPEPEPTPAVIPEPAQDDSGNAFICEKCGAAVSKVQRDVSNLFMGKTLCKSCMK